MVKILVAEDETRLRKLICSYLKQEGYKVVEAADGDEAIDKFYSDKYNLIILDIMMPKINGFEVCSEIRSMSDVPIIMLTARNTEYDELTGFKYGVDEYITKPFSTQILLSRIKALLKRSGVIHKDELCIGNVRIVYREHNVYDGNKRILLTPREYDLICYFIENKEQVLSREQILESVWGIDYDGDMRTVDTHIKCLRYKIPSLKRKLRTIRKSGYILEE
ncbi:MAG: response regulator transcription factor [Oscillospiraceae bacterium]|nr:response regulator transcription factor [Oscillospiraceae bacterium]